MDRRQKGSFAGCTWSIILLALALLDSSGCSRGGAKRMWSRYQQAVESGRNTIPYAKDFTELFPKAQCTIQYYTGTVGDPAWQATVELYGRYELHVQIPVTLNEERTKVISYDDPTFVLLEVKSAVGRGRTYGMSRRFGKEEWEEVVGANGNLSVLGVKIVPDRPVLSDALED